MAIEFLCPGCQKALRVADAAAGKQARCPGCGSIAVVPPATPAPPTHGGIDPRDVPPTPRAPSPSVPLEMPSIPPPPGPPPPGPPPQGMQGQPQLQPVNDLFAHQQSMSGQTTGGASANPFQSPHSQAYVQQRTIAGPARLQPTLINVGDVFSLAWDIFKENALLCAGVYLLQLVLLVVAQIPYQVIVKDAKHAGPTGIILIMVAFLAMTAFQLWLHCGSIRFCLKLARGQQAEVADLFSGGPYIGSVLLGSILVWLIVVAATFGVMIPIGAIAFAASLAAGASMGLLVMVASVFVAAVVFIGVMISLGQFMFLIVDQNMGVIDALNWSLRITAGNRLTVFFTFLILIVTTPFAILFTCCIGIVFVMPYIGLLMTVMYMAMCGQFEAYSDEPMPVLTPLR